MMILHGRGQISAHDPYRINTKPVISFVPPSAPAQKLSRPSSASVQDGLGSSCVEARDSLIALIDTTCAELRVWRDGALTGAEHEIRGGRKRRKAGFIDSYSRSVGRNDRCFDDTYRIGESCQSTNGSDSRRSLCGFRRLALSFQRGPILSIYSFWQAYWLQSEMGADSRRIFRYWTRWHFHDFDILRL
jgi:hypothetical protein